MARSDYNGRGSETSGTTFLVYRQSHLLYDWRLGHSSPIGQGAPSFLLLCLVIALAWQVSRLRIRGLPLLRPRVSYAAKNVNYGQQVPFDVSYEAPSNHN